MRNRQRSRSRLRSRPKGTELSNNRVHPFSTTTETCSSKYDGDEQHVQQCKICEEDASRNGSYYIKTYGNYSGHLSIIRRASRYDTNSTTRSQKSLRVKCSSLGREILSLSSTNDEGNIFLLNFLIWFLENCHNVKMNLLNFVVYGIQSN